MNKEDCYHENTDFKRKGMYVGSFMTITLFIMVLIFTFLFMQNPEAKLIKDKEINMHRYKVVLNHQKNLRSAYFNQAVLAAMDDGAITNAEFTELKEKVTAIQRKRKTEDADLSKEQIDSQIKKVKQEIMDITMLENANLF